MSRRRSAFQQRRRALGFSQEGLAAELGVDRSTVARWESGSSVPHPWQRPRIAQALQITRELANEFFSESGVDPLALARIGETSGVVASQAASMPDERVHELYLRGQSLLAENHRPEVEAARTLLDRAVRNDPSFARAVAARGYATWRQYFAGWAKHADALTSAIDDVRAAMNTDPDSVGAHLTFVRVAWDMGWHEQGLSAGRSVHQRHPDSLEATITFARALNNAGLAQHAIPLLNAVLTIDPTNPAATKLAVWCHMLTGQYSYAVRLGRAHIERHPHDANTRWAMAMAARNIPGGLADAIAIASEACGTDPEDVTLWLLLGYLQQEAGQSASAANSWSEGIAHAATSGTDPTNLRVLAWTANLHAAVGEENAARQLVDRVAESQPENGYLTYRRAHVLAQLGLHHEAVTTYDDAITQGFLSIQLAHHEESLALAPLTGRADYRTVLRRLASRVAAARETYASNLPEAPITTHPHLLEESHDAGAQ